MNETTLRRWYSEFKSGNELTEIRVLADKKTFSGYFTNIDKIIAAIKPFDQHNIYFTLNAVNPACYSRAQRDQMLAVSGNSTSQSDIVGRDFVLIDIDVIRPSGTNSTNEELAHARLVAGKVFKFLREQGFYDPAVCMSGNGYHLILRAGMENNSANTETVKRFLEALDMLFTDQIAHVDTAPFDPNRICRLYGTTTRKGTNLDAERPQRESEILYIPEGFERINRNEYFEKVARLLPEVEAPQRFNNYNAEAFDLDRFIADHGIAIAKESRFAGGRKLVLQECPFDHNHKAPDAALFQMDNGAIGFRCLHASCAHFNWRDFRLHYDPEAYDKRDRAEYTHKRNYYGRVSPPPEVKIIEGDDERGPHWLKPSSIKTKDLSQLVSIPTGIEALDKKIVGLFLGDVTIISGISGAGKSTLLNHLTLSAIQRGFRAAIFSGELQDFRYLSWLDQMAAGKAFVRPVPGYDGIYNATPEVAKKINEWLDDKLWIFNNAYGSKWGQLFADVKKCVVENQTQIVFIDNLMSLQLDLYQGEKNDKQTQFINDVKDLAKSANVHIVLVCHPRKEDTKQLLRKESIAGTADLTNLCDNLFLLHRVGLDFEKKASEFFGAAKTSDLMNYDLVIESSKNRAFGVVDYVLGLYYEQESRRIKNDPADNVVYGWQDQPVQAAFTLNDDDGDMPDFDKYTDF